MELTSSGSRCSACEAAYLGAIQARKNAEFGGSGGRWQTIRREVYARQEGRCAKCGNELGTSFEVDHVRPRALGGQSVPENLQALCPKPCHLEKSSRDRQQLKRFVA